MTTNTKKVDIERRRQVLREELEELESAIAAETQVVKKQDRKVIVSFSDAIITIEGAIEVTVPCNQLANGEWWPANEKANVKLYEAIPDFIDELDRLARKHGVSINRKKFEVTDVYGGEFDSIRLATGEDVELW